jgi:hypothetical protein
MLRGRVAAVRVARVETLGPDIRARIAHVRGGSGECRKWITYADLRDP